MLSFSYVCVQCFPSLDCLDFASLKEGFLSWVVGIFFFPARKILMFQHGKHKALNTCPLLEKELL